MLRAIWRMKAPDRKNGPSLPNLPVEILQSIRNLLLVSSAACFTISSRHLLRILGSKSLHSLRGSGCAWEEMERDLPNWQLCHPRSLFRPSLLHCQSTRINHSETNIVVELRKWLGLCKDPFDPDWRNHCDLSWNPSWREPTSDSM